MTGMSTMRTTMTSAQLRRAVGHAPGVKMSAFSGTTVYTKMAMIMTMMRNAVPQRTCRRGKLRAHLGRERKTVLVAVDGLVLGAVIAEHALDVAACAR